MNIWTHIRSWHTQVLLCIRLNLEINFRVLSNILPDELRNSFHSWQTALVQIIDHLLYCKDKLFGAGSVYAKQQQTSRMVMMLTTLPKFIIDSIAMDFVPLIHARLKFTSAHMQNIISALRLPSIDESQLKEENSKDIVMCLRSSFSYAAKLLNLALKAASEASKPVNEAFKLVDDLLDLITSSELYSGSNFTSSLITAAKPWLPDLILAQGSACTLEQIQAEKAYLTVSAKTELSATSEGGQEEEGDHSIFEPDEFPGFKRFMGTIVSLLKGKSNLMDAVGLILLICSVVGLGRKGFGLVLGLLHFVCVKLIGQDSKEWSGLAVMLVSLPNIYPHIEREIEEQTHVMKKKGINYKLPEHYCWSLFGCFICMKLGGFQ
ncbi:hypothetical protein SLEP1_g11780 [Rubroshorea leprosula]|nr:hypothetical protein SLEP1_g11780 [Rubroshorea leprosula]